ncbi:MAG TPA: copper chaperone PCu(A)C [Gammaproteobacteria bacterium]|nr:copper chaperone PCu(A)C [Gammaproteobacteria bacterium]
MARLLGGLLLLGLVATAHAGDIAVSGTYARATPPGATVGAVYLELRNTGVEPDRLLSAAAPVAARTEVHTHTMQDGVARMHEVPAVELPAGATVQFQPGGFHIMLIELKAPLTEGESFPLTLNFERAGELSLTVPVQKITALMPSHGGGQSHGHGRHH